MTEDKYLSDLEIVKRENEPNYISIEIFEEVNRNDSIIKNFRSVVNNKNRASSSNLYIMLLNKPFPDFKFQDLNNNWYAKSRFLGKPTVVCFIHPKGNEDFPLCSEGVLVELVQAPEEVVDAKR